MNQKQDWLTNLSLVSQWVSKHIKPTRILLSLSLILALLASLDHVAYAFSSVNGGSMWAGYMSAIALDVGLISLAIGIKSRKSQGRSSLLLWAGVFGFSLVSVYANWLSGVAHLVSVEANTGDLGEWLVWLRPILLSGVLPCMVVYLSEIVSGDWEIDEKIAKKEERRRVQRLTTAANDTRQAQTDNDPVSHLEKANDTRQAQIQYRQAQVFELSRKGMSQSDIANELGVSLATIKRDTKNLNGAIK